MFKVDYNNKPSDVFLKSDIFYTRI